MVGGEVVRGRRTGVELIVELLMMRMRGGVGVRRRRRVVAAAVMIRILQTVQMLRGERRGVEERRGVGRLVMEVEVTACVDR